MEKIFKYIIFVQLLLLISCSSDVNGYEFSNFVNTEISELAEAVKNNDTIKIRQLINEHGYNVDAKEPFFGQTLLSLAIVNNKRESFVELLENGANPNILLGIKNNSSPLITAIYKQNNCELFYVKHLLDNGADSNMLIEPKNGVFFNDSYPLYTAIGKGVSGDECLDVIKLLVKYGADINSCNPRPMAPETCDGVLEKCITYNCMIFLRYFVIDQKINIPDIVHVRGAVDPSTQVEYSLSEILKTEDFQFENYPTSRRARNEILSYLKETNQE